MSGPPCSHDIVIHIYVVAIHYGLSARQFPRCHLQTHKTTNDDHTLHTPSLALVLYMSCTHVAGKHASQPKRPAHPHIEVTQATPHTPSQVSWHGGSPSSSAGSSSLTPPRQASAEQRAMGLDGLFLSALRTQSSSARPDALLPQRRAAPGSPGAFSRDSRWALPPPPPIYYRMVSVHFAPNSTMVHTLPASGTGGPGQPRLVEPCSARADCATLTKGAAWSVVAGAASDTTYTYAAAGLEHTCRPNMCVCVCVLGSLSTRCAGRRGRLAVLQRVATPPDPWPFCPAPFACNPLAWLDPAASRPPPSSRLRRRAAAACRMGAGPLSSSSMTPAPATCTWSCPTTSHRRGSYRCTGRC